MPIWCSGTLWYMSSIFAVAWKETNVPLEFKWPMGDTEGQGLWLCSAVVRAVPVKTARSMWPLQCQHCVPHPYSPPGSPQPWSARFGLRQCQFTVSLQCGHISDLAELKYPRRSSLAHVLGNLHAAKPFWAEGCPAGCTLPPSKWKWSEVHGEIYPDIVCLSLCHCLLPKQLSHVNIPQVLWCVHHTLSDELLL